MKNDLCIVTDQHRIVHRIYVVHVGASDEIATIIDHGSIKGQKQLAEKMGISHGNLRKRLNDKRPFLERYISDDLTLTKDARWIHDLITRSNSIEIFKTAKPSELAEIYVLSESPAMFKEITGHKGPLHTADLQRRGLLHDKYGHEISRKRIAKLMKTNEGITRLLTPKAQRLVEDTNNIFNLMAYYSASTVSFNSIIDPASNQVWDDKIRPSNFKEKARIFDLLATVNDHLKKAEPKNIDVDKTISATFQIRTGHLPLMDVSASSKLVIEGREIIHAAEKKRSPKLLTLGMTAYFGSDFLQDHYYPIAMIPSDSLQLISKDGKLPKSGQSVKILYDSTAEWSRKQEMAIRHCGAKPVKTEKKSNYEELAEQIKNGKVDLAAVPAPMHFLTEYYGYSTISLDFNNFLSSSLHTNALLLASRELVIESPEKILGILELGKQAYDQFTGNDGKPNTKFENFINKAELSKPFNDHCKNLMGIGNKGLKNFVDEHRSSV